MSRLIVFDTNGVIHRAYHAMPSFTRAGDSKHVGAIGGFWQIIYRTLKYHVQARPDDLIAFACDSPGRLLRHDIDENYKGNRPEKDPELTEQIDDIRVTMGVSGVEVLVMPGYEADDIMATVAFHRAQRGQDTVIVSADKDMMQCMPYATLFGWVYEERINDHGQPFKLYVQRLLTLEDCREKFGCAPELVTTALALMGDTSDNYAGVKGVGIKGATRLMETYGDLEAILAAAEGMAESKMRSALIEHAETARKGLQLATVNTDVPGLPGVWSTTEDIDWTAVASRLRRFGLVSAPDEIERGME